jgi:hypothetical protein
MKISPFVIFLILLIVLVVSIILGRKIGYEGFISYQKSTVPGNNFVIPTYSNNSVDKLYDNLFFDPINANLIEIDSPQFNTANGEDVKGNTVLTTSIVTRNNNGSSNSYSGNAIVPPSIPNIGTNIISSYNNFTYNTQSKNTDKYCVFYIPWDIDTYIHIINVNSKTHIGTYLESKGSSKTFSSNIYNLPAISLTSSSSDNDTNNNTFVLDNYYDNKKMLYQISKNVKYDITNGTLILQTATTTKTIAIYTRSNMSTPTIVNLPNTVANTASTVQSISFSPVIIDDKLGNVKILYIPNGTNTVVAVFGLTNDMSSYKINNVVRFTANTVDVGSGSSSTNNVVTMFNSFLSNYWKNPWEYENQYQYFSQYGYLPPYQGYPNTYSPMGGYSDNYILKTQVVPPVCPSCPSCPNNAVCTNCGGNGGSGTKSSNGGTMVSDNNTGYYSHIGSGTFSSNADPNKIAGGLTLTGYDTVAGIEDVAKTGADVLKTGLNNAALGVGAVGLGIGAAGLGLGDAVSDTVSGAGSLAEKAGGGTVDLLKSAGSGAVGLLKGAGSGAMSLTNNNSGVQGGYSGVQGGYSGVQGGYSGVQGGNSGIQGGNSGIQGGNTPISRSGPQYIDQYSYYGALPSKGNSNFMPVTADFSAFKN